MATAGRTNRISGAAWYAPLAKPFLAPSAEVFGLVWTVLQLGITWPNR